MKTVKPIVAAIFLTVLLLAETPPAMAHDVTIQEAFLLSDVYEENSIEHDDEDDWKGFLQITVTNTGDVAWDDFHFQIFEFDDDQDTDVIFTANDPDGEQDWTPRSTHELSDWVIGTDRNTLDFYFENDPVFSNNSVTFSVYTDNTDEQQASFGISFFATPVPLPGAAILLVSGIMAAFGFRRKHLQ